ncbi:MAG: hypothetical protein PHY80_05080, partial [Rickettsiales bacterium]|nr:hypothetical protein [Rickettsiales bacterium]
SITSIEVSGTCNTGYEPADNADYPVRLCNRDGTWGSMIVGCVAICEGCCDNDELRDTNDYSITFENAFDYNDETENGICLNGYFFGSGGAATTISFTCNNSVWNWQYSSTCTITSCLNSSLDYDPYIPADATVTSSYPNPSGTTPIGNTQSITFTIVSQGAIGGVDATCQSDGTWSYEAHISM